MLAWVAGCARRRWADGLRHRRRRLPSPHPPLGLRPGGPRRHHKEAVAVVVAAEQEPGLHPRTLLSAMRCLRPRVVAVVSPLVEACPQPLMPPSAPREEVTPVHRRQGRQLACRHQPAQALAAVLAARHHRHRPRPPLNLQQPPAVVRQAPVRVHALVQVRHQQAPERLLPLLPLHHGLRPAHGAHQGLGGCEPRLHSRQGAQPAL